MLRAVGSLPRVLLATGIGLALLGLLIGTPVASRAQSSLSEILPALDVSRFGTEYQSIPTVDRQKRVEFVRNHRVAALAYLQGLLTFEAYLAQVMLSEPDDLKARMRDAILATAAEIAEDYGLAFSDPYNRLRVEYYRRSSPVQRMQSRLGDLLNSEGVEAIDRQDYSVALDRFDAALDRYRTADDRLGEADVRGNRGKALVEIGRYREALPELRTALDLRRDLGDLHHVPSAVTGLGAALYSLGEYEEALKLHREALQKLDERADAKLYGDVLGNIGNALRETGHSEDAVANYRCALEIFRHIGNTDQEHWILNNLGITFKSVGDYSMALEYLEQALRMSLARNDKAGQATTLTNSGAVYMLRGDYDRAVSLYRDALTIHRELKALQGIAATLVDLAVVYQEVGEWNRALDALREAQRLAVENGDLKVEAIAIINIGAIRQSQGDYDGALRAFEAAQSLRRRLGHRQDDDLAVRVGTIRRELGQREDALQWFERALKLARQAGNIQGEAVALANSGLTLAELGRHGEALAQFEAAIDIAERIGSKQGILVSHHNLARSLTRLGRLAEALLHHDRAIVALESIRRGVTSDEWKMGLATKVTAVYHAAVRTAMALHGQDPTKGYDRLAFDYAERGKARGLVDLLADSAALVSVGVSRELVEQRRDISRQLAALEAMLLRLRSQPQLVQDGQLIQRLRDDILRLESQETALLEEIRRKHPRYAELVNPRLSSVEDLRRVLAPGEALIEYVVTDAETIAFVLSTSGFEAVIWPAPAAQVSALAHEVRAELSRSSYQLQVSEKAYATLFQPLEGIIGNPRIVYVVPDEALHSIPFEIFAHEGAWLGDRFALAYVQSGSVLAGLRERRGSPRAPEPIVIIADADYRGHASRTANANGGSNSEHTLAGDACASKAFLPLPGTAAEAEGLASLFEVDPKGDALNTRDRATESRVKGLDLARYRYIHFAVHGILCDEEGSARIQPSLVLSRPEESDQEIGNDGLLQMKEVLNLSLRADLVTLSACSTGLGRRVSGEGIVGLTRAFMYAGADTVVVSLWNVDDPSTAAFMREFYGRLKAGTAKAEALATARRWLREYSYHKDHAGAIVEHSHPFYWAPFILIGGAE